MRRQDFWTGLILSTVSLGVVAESWRMPRDLQGWPAYAGPGTVTGFLGLGLLGMAMALLIRAWRRAGPGLALQGAQVRAYLVDPGTRRLALMLLLSAAYVLALGRQIPYHATTGAYLVVTMLLFRAGPWWAVFLIGGAVTAAVALVFNRIFLIPLP